VSVLLDVRTYLFSYSLLLTSCTYVVENSDTRRADSGPLIFLFKGSCDFYKGGAIFIREVVIFIREVAILLMGVAIFIRELRFL
jgi:hypothetical protein